MIAVLLQTVFFCIVVYYLAYALLELRMVIQSKKGEQMRLTKLKSAASAVVDRSRLPLVSVLLPVCNESSVIERLIDAVCGLDYPSKKLEVLVLNDSTDETIALAAASVARHSACGTDIRLCSRENRGGFKAGNLSYGATVARGEFFAIFDADFIPPEDFLLKTIPCFEDPAVGFLQTGIGYANRDASCLTRFQAMEMGHQQFVTEGLSQGGLLGSLSGSSCVWRRTCVENVGGWNAETITEDTDLGYRAQFGQWKYAYLPDVVSLSELPETISAFRIQRDRWARGLIHNAFKHFRSMLATRMSCMQRLHAIALMLSSLLLASFYVLILQSLPLALLTDELGPFFDVTCSIFLATAVLWGSSNFWGSHKGAKLASGEPAWRSILQMPAYVAMFLPMSLYYFGAGVQLLIGGYGSFNRTPKGGTAWNADTPAVSTVLLVLELLTFAYSAAALAVAVAAANYWVVLFSLIVCSGFAMPLILSWQERQERARRLAPGQSLQTILITGATGSIGGALALEYAKPGRTLVLQGRRNDRLHELAALCEQRGAKTVCLVIDLLHRQTWRTSLAELCEREPIDLIVVNAGLNSNIGPDGKGECWEDVEALVQVNLLAAMATVDAALPSMRRRGQGQIALMSSLAGYYGLPVTPSYCASKAAIKAYGEALRGWLGPEGIRVNVVMPGYVASPMCHAMPGPKPFLWSAERAARRIRRGLERNQPRISFPFPLNIGSWLLAVLAPSTSERISRLLGYGG